MHMLKTLKTVKLNLVKIIARFALGNNSAPSLTRSTKKILVYGHMGIGNMVMFTPFLKALRSHYSDAQIILLVGNSGCAPVIDESSLVDRIQKMEGTFFQRFKTILDIRKSKFDLLISSFHGSSFYYVTMLLNIPHRLGHVSGPDWESKYDFLYNIPVQMGENEHEIERGLKLMHALGVEPVDDRPEFYLPNPDVDFVTDFFHENHIDENDLLIAVQADTWRAQQWKRWDPAKLAKVCDLAKDKWNAKIIIFGAPGHLEELNEFLELLRYQPIIALGKSSLKQSAALLKKCSLAVCNDSGLMHISAALGVPTIGIYGPTDFHRTSHIRYGENHSLVRKEIPCAPCFRMRGDQQVVNCKDRICLESISTDDVMAAIGKTIINISDRKNSRYVPTTENECLASR
ncbi:MAG: glycosyltransferase family 9 protein [Calditrichaeota bacterium]|nr:MAG: glycosyltransferase family 9 protein [Calditrichota bacterium]